MGNRFPFKRLVDGGDRNGQRFFLIPGRNNNREQRRWRQYLLGFSQDCERLERSGLIKPTGIGFGMLGDFFQNCQSRSRWSPPPIASLLWSNQEPSTGYQKREERDPERSHAYQTVHRTKPSIGVVTWPKRLLRSH